MKDIVFFAVMAFVIVAFFPVAVLLWKTAIDELFGSDRRRELDRLIAQRIAEIEKLAEDVK